MSALSLLLAALLAGCAGGGSDNAMPKPKAWPRLEPYPAAYHAVRGIAVNDSAVVATDSLAPDGTRWLTLIWPRYAGATLYLTVTPGATQADLANRLERFSRNTTGARTFTRRLDTPRGHQAMIVEATAGGSVTPLQLLAFKEGAEMVSASVYMPVAATAPPDSIAPWLEAMEADLEYLTLHLQ